MVTKHLTDEEIQLFAFDKANSEVRAVEHVYGCNDCKAKVELYRALITDIEQQPGPSFDFDLSAAVLQKLPLSTQKTSNDRSLTWIFIFICIGLVGGCSYFFRSYIDALFKGVAAIFIYLIVISAITVIGAMFFDMYKKYRDEMKVLDLH
jgi:hypothetical protein